MEPTTMSEEIERERAHPNTPSAPPRPAYRRQTQACPPHACDPTMRSRAGADKRHACGRHCMRVGVSVWQCGYAAASLDNAQHLRRPQFGAHECTLVRLRDGWSAIPIEEDGCARSRRITREQQLAAAPLQPGGTASLDRWHLAHCPPRLHRWCAAAAALANTSTWAAP